MTSPALIQPQVAASSETGSFRFPLIPIGTYSVKFELPGFKTVVREGIVVSIGFTAQVNQQLAISTVQETVTVSGESPIVDTKATAAKTTFDLESLQNIPSARDPWVMLQRVPNISMDRVNVGGSQSGQQSGYISRGGNTSNNKWSLDGVDITDMSATGASPIYYDFDMMQEMQVTTGGADASQQTGGVGINFVTRSGTNRFKGSGRIYNTNDAFEARQRHRRDSRPGRWLGRAHPEHQRLRLRSRRADHAGQALVLGQLRQAGHQGRRRELLQADTDLPARGRSGRRDCRHARQHRSHPRLSGDRPHDARQLQRQADWAPARNNKINFQNTWGGKVRNARDASETRPLETAYRQKNIDGTAGTFGWDAGPVPIWKVERSARAQRSPADRHPVRARRQQLHADVPESRTGGRPAAVRHRVRRPGRARSTSRSSCGRRRASTSRPATSCRRPSAATTRSRPATAGARRAAGRSATRAATPSRATRTRRPSCADFGGGCNADLFRDGYTKYNLGTQRHLRAGHYTVKRLTLNLGVRWDRATDEALPARCRPTRSSRRSCRRSDFPGHRCRRRVERHFAAPGHDLRHPRHRQVGRPRVLLDVLRPDGARPARRRDDLDRPGDRALSVGGSQRRHVRSGQRAEYVANPTKSASFDPTNPTSFLSPGSGRSEPQERPDA